ncbi:LysR family transcriptional regulator [Salmonella enterica subsp. enterica]|uniref:LysR family transcriptional regulator n=1 Tax=Salmonella enterica I TaxID=59201 RepID=A0A379WY68_SALET|nr:LysR family transcriptional regulator [Salmonella enterica subsp. enterica]
MGMGIILESNLLAGQSVSQRHLAPVFTTDVSMPVNAHHFVLPHHNEQKEKVRIFFNWVSKRAKPRRISDLIAGGKTNLKCAPKVNQSID